MAELDDRITPRPGLKDIAYIRDGIAKGGAVFLAFDVVAKGPAGPGWLLFEKTLEDGDCFLDGLFEG